MQKPKHIFNPNSCEAYDIEVSRCHNIVKQMVTNGIGLKGQYEGSDGLEKMEFHLFAFLKDYCKHNKIPYFLHDSNINRLIVYPSEDNTYTYFLALGIIGTDYAKIFRFLDYQFSIYPEYLEDFFVLLEYMIYYSVGSISPILDESLRQSYIMSWIRFKRNPEAGLHIPTQIIYPAHGNDTSEDLESSKPNINFVNIDVERLAICLAPYFDKSSFEDLRNVLHNKFYKKKPVFKSSANTFAHVFYELKKEDRILETKTRISKWICTNFQYLKDDSTTKSFDEEYVRKVLSGQKKTNVKISLALLINLN